MPPPADPLARFSAPVRSWFAERFEAPTPAQSGAWEAVARGDHALVLAPTGSGKTLAAFLWAIDRLVAAPPPGGRTHRTRLVYVSPVRALAVDVERNLREPLAGIAARAAGSGEGAVTPHLPTVGVRTGDTPADERRRLQRQPPDILITTPESLYLMLTSAARETLAGVEAVIVDEIHALAATKRGAHLSLTLERLAEVAQGPVQRIGLSATQRPLAEVGRFLAGHDEGGAPRPVAVVDAGTTKDLEVEVVVPPGALDGGAPAWEAIVPRLLELIEAHRSTIVFTNARRLAERLAAQLNELAAARAAGSGQVSPSLVHTHHGALSRERRAQVEEDLKAGRVRGLVATSTLELGIDMGAVDLVVQVESPGSVSAGLQRVGRAGHHVGAASRGRVLPKHRGDLLEAAVVVDRMARGEVEATTVPRNPLDVLAQQVVAMCAVEDWPVERLAAVVRRSACFADLPDRALDAVLDLLAGRYPSEDFAGLRPRLVWDRVGGVVRARAGAQRLAVTSGGTIPDRGLFGVFLPDGTRVGELDEEMVLESRPGDTFLLGASTWRIQQITHERVVVAPAPGEPGRMPFWRGDGPGRPVELGRALGAFVRGLRDLPADEVEARLRQDHPLDAEAARQLAAHLAEQAAATGAVPDDRTVVVERFRDEVGDWRVCVLSPFGARVHAPWAMAVQARIAARHGWHVEALWSDDGIVLRLPEAVEALPLDELALDPEEVAEVVVGQLPGTALFAGRFRECAARALLLPPRRPGQRTPLWQQRQRSADLLAVAADHPEFPILHEATRECVEDVFDLPALRQLLGQVRSGQVSLVAVDTPRASPFSRSLLFGWVAVYMYEGDAPLAERRAAALALDRDLLADLLGAEELRDLVDPEVLAGVEEELQRRAEGWRARDADQLHDLLRVLGPLTGPELADRADAPAGEVAGWSDALVAEGRAYPAVVAGQDRLAAAEDAGRLRDALGVPPPPTVPAALAEAVPDPVGDLVARHARTHGPFLAPEVAERWGLPLAVVASALAGLEAAGRVVRGELRPEGVEPEWCDAEVARRLRRRSLAALRRQVEPVDGPALARFLARWQGVAAAQPDRLAEPGTGGDALAGVVASLQGAAIAASVLEADVLPARLPGYRPADLDARCAAGEVVWVGAGALGPGDGRVRLAFRDRAGLLVPAAPDAERPEGPVADALRDHLGRRGASFWPDLVAAAHAAGAGYDEATVLGVLWDLVWAGEVTNDSLAPLRARLAAGAGVGRARAGAAPGGGRGDAGDGADALRALGRGRRPALGRRGRAAAARVAGRGAGGLTRSGPPAASGRWSLVAPLLEPRRTPTEVAHAQALQLLERHGVLTREAVLAEGGEGGFAAAYPVLQGLEDRGQVRRGYFVAGLGAAQFALPGAVDRLRAARDEGEVGAAPVVLAATDPAQPWGAALPWPPSEGRPARVAGAHVVLVGGHPVAVLERGGRGLVTFGAAASHPGWAAALADLVRSGRLRRLEVARIDGQPAATSTWAAELAAAGFVPGYRGLVCRP